MEIIKINPHNPEPDKIKYAASLLRKGKLVVFPTETVYGLGASLNNKDAINKVYKIKRRPKNKPLTIHIADKKDLVKIVNNLNSVQKELVDRFWPGPLTIIFKKNKDESVGVRMPRNKIAIELIKQAKVLVVAPSANISGNLAPTCCKEVLEQLNSKPDVIIDGGKTQIGIESSVIDTSSTPAKLLREKAISRKELAKWLNFTKQDSPKVSS